MSIENEETDLGVEKGVINFNIYTRLLVKV